MGSINNFYLQTISSKKAGYRANWEPNKPLEIGDIGVIENGVFVVMTTLKNEGINMNVRIDTSDSNWKFTTENDVSIQAKAKGEAPIAGSVLSDLEAGISVSFKSENAFVFEAVGAKNHIIINVFEIEKAFIAKAKEDKRWKNFAVIVELIEANSATIIMSSGKNNVVDLKAKADVSLANLNLANTELGLSIVSEKISTDTIVAQQGIKPIYRAMGLRHPLFGSAHMETKSMGPPQKKESFKILEFDTNELK